MPDAGPAPHPVSTGLGQCWDGGPDNCPGDGSDGIRVVSWNNTGALLGTGMMPR